MQHGNRTTKLVFAVIASFIIFGLTENAYASNSTFSCSESCTPPTLGVTKTGKVLVENGFSYNGNPVNVNSFYTHYPLITADVGRENVATFKVYDNGGPQNISHFALAFGIGQGKNIFRQQSNN